MGHAGKATVTLRTIDGRVLSQYTYDLGLGKQTLALELPDNLSEGIILVEVGTADLRVVKKIVIDK